ncbi:MAG: entS [Rariglobus sp.]|jgi:MFS family permease|nr:entS [Rariglobus sp.]
MSAPYAPHDPYAALRHTAYRRYLIGTFCANVGRQMTSVAVAWQIYQWTHSATALGLVGLLNVIPLLVCLLPAGALADRFDRKRIITLSTAALACLSVLLACVAFFHEAVPRLAILDLLNGGLRRLAMLFEQQADPISFDFTHPALPVVYAILLVMGVVRILGWPARSAIVPQLVPPGVLSNTLTWNSSAFEIATMTGPAIGGFLIAWAGFPVVYVLDALCGLSLLVLLTRVHVPPPVAPVVAMGKRSWRSLLAGAEFIWNKKVVLAASGLDMFAVLLGGAVALLPIYADQILHVGPIGLGWLRAAPSIGAFGMAMWIAHRRPMQRPGLMLLWAVAGFGVAIVVFGLSHWFWLSFIALLATGSFDNVSVVVRQSLVQLLTPNHLRGRVTSVNQIFVGSSNEIGTLRAGLMAALVGPVAAVVWGGVGTILTVLVIARAVPQLKTVAPLDQLRAED